MVLFDILREKVAALNPRVPESAREEAIARLTDRRYTMSQILANKEVYNLIRDGMPVEYENAKGKKSRARVRFIDFNNAAKNDFLAVTQLWIKGERYFRRPDILLYVNGIPLVFIELKNSNIALRNAYDDNLTNYRHDIPLLFQYNAICILSNAIETRVGSVTAGWEHFFHWLRVDDEREKVDRKELKRARDKRGAGHSGPLRTGSPSGLPGELHPLLPERHQDHRPEPPVHRRQQGYRSPLKPEMKERGSSASSGTPRARARASP